jgi:hypothetical protein
VKGSMHKRARRAGHRIFHISHLLVAVASPFSSTPFLSFS